MGRAHGERFYFFLTEGGLEVFFWSFAKACPSITLSTFATQHDSFWFLLLGGAWRVLRVMGFGFLFCEADRYISLG
mgnify:CR=1 FL=1